MACACGKDTCGCEAPEMVYLQDEHGNTHEFYVAERLKNEYHKYVLLVSVEDSEQLALLRVVETPDGAVQYRNIESETEWNQVQETLFQPH